jgi:YidC/Oxa1 family membrane protein insertase
MFDLFFNLIIFPLVQLIQLSFVLVYRIFDNIGIAIIGVSIAVSVYTLPLYLIAEKHQQSERETWKRLKPKVDKIKKVFSGDKQYMILSTYYRQNHYHPVYSIRNTVGLLVQIPFFIAAYSYLSHLEILQEVSFLFIKNLSVPDGLVTLNIGENDYTLNILPIAMTCINCVSGIVYTKGLAIKEKIQLFGMAFVFLVLLYTSPSGLVLYWIMNNVFSLAKNCFQKLKNAKLFLYRFLCVIVILFDTYLIFFHTGWLPKRILVAVICSSIFFIPIFKTFFVQNKIRIKSKTTLNDTALVCHRTFFASSIMLFLLAGMVIPSALIASSVQEFCFIENNTSPFPFLYYTLIQSAGIFLFWPCCIYFLFSQKTKIALTLFMSLLCGIAMVNIFLFPGYYGFLTPTLNFSDPAFPDVVIIIANILALLFTSVFFILLLLTKKRMIFNSFQVIAIISFLSFYVLKLTAIQREYSAFLDYRETEQSSENLKSVYRFTMAGQNVVVIMLDRGISAYVPYIFQEKPELNKMFSGFTYFPNTVSLAWQTIKGVPPLFGGYDYTPLEMQRQDNKLLVEKNNEALLLLPALFSENNYTVTVTDPPFANYNWTSDLRIYEPYPDTHAENIAKEYISGKWMLEHRDLQLISISGVLKNDLIRFSFFKIAPPIFRMFIYDDGKWLRENHGVSLDIKVINSYAALDFLPKLTMIDDNLKNTITLLTSQLTHEDAIFQAPDYTPRSVVTNRGDSSFAEGKYYHSNIAAFLLLGKWFSFLQENGAYNNTRIIIASDHGDNLSSNFPGMFMLPDGSYLQRYNCLLMAKDFNAQGPLLIDDTFMTHADVPFLAAKDLIENPLNPFTQRPLRSEKHNGAFIATSDDTLIDSRGKYKFDIQKDEWLHVKDNIFDISNWQKVIIEK